MLIFLLWISLSFTQIYIIVFFVLTLGLVCSFTSVWRQKVRVLIWDLSCFLNIRVYCFKFLFKQCFATPRTAGCWISIIFYFLISIVIFLWLMEYLKVCVLFCFLISTYLLFPKISFYWFPTLFHYKRKYFAWFQFFFVFVERLVLLSNFFMIYLGEWSTCTWGKNAYSAVTGWIVYRCLLGSAGLQSCLSLSLLVDLLPGSSIHYCKCGIEVFNSYFWISNFSLLFCQFLFHVSWGSIVGCIYAYNCHITQ